MLEMLKEKLISLFQLNNYKTLDRLYLPLDRSHIRRTKNIRLIPTEDNRQGGKYSYAEWAHVIGIFQTLMFLHLDKKEGNNILDIGCGTGLMGIASEPFLEPGGRYTGIDVMKDDIDFCRAHYPSPPFEFIHFNINNPAYAPSQKNKKIEWPVEAASYDLVTALSVWTHLNEEDAFFYLKETNRALKPGGKAIITFFTLDDLYKKKISGGCGDLNRYYMKFDMGEIAESYPGNWKEVPGIYFQDVLILKKA